MRWSWLLLVCASPVWATKVLLIESYHSTYPWDASYVEGLNDTLTSKVELVSYSMDTKRLPSSEHAEQADNAFAFYQQHQPEIVILGDDNAFNYLLPKLYDEPISIVFLGVNANPRALLSQYRGQAKVTGVLERPLFVKSLGELRRLFERERFQVKILFDSGVTSKIAKDYIQKQYSLIKNNLGIEVDIQAIETKQQWEQQVLTAKQSGFSAIIVGLYQTLVDEQGNNVPAEQVITWTRNHSPLPIFAFWDFAVGENKAAGGVVLFGYSQGTRAAQLVNQIIQTGHDPIIPIVTDNQGKAIYSKKEFERWQLEIPYHWQAVE
ncbi:hypothetical protein FCU94_16480 [Vibrio sp. JPW-9-11-11]|uniref:ABC transporter substrate-binding protein n=1 Tax=Vibrio sp. JPW-9-11-11 TaxID=1416532 RepID=UPI00159457D5|nr:hypothetical protein [Vibrio sp. JPW-9-11-11]NVD08444.1 hypothetical protein [Vibrio sp. JPW-9-11-11]